jgi:hypothetical protein
VEIKKPMMLYSTINAYRAVDRADQYFSFYSVLRKTIKWSIKEVLYLLNCSLFNAFFVNRTLKKKKKVKYKNILHEVGRSWISEVQDRNPILMTFSCKQSKQQGGLNRTCQADCAVISENTNLKKLLVMGRGKRKYPARPCKVCAAHEKQSDSKIHL